MENWQVVLITLGVVVVLLVVYMIASAGSLGAYFAARRIGQRWLKDASFQEKVDNLMAPSKPQPPAKPSAEPLWLLTLLQREGRLLDFLLEDIEGYGNEQIGAAVRDIHRNCKKAIRDHLVLQPVLPQAEGSSVEVPANMDPSAIRLTGNVAGSPPYRGSLQHHGWRVAEIKLSRPPEGQDQFIVQPAEVEVA